MPSYGNRKKPVCFLTIYLNTWKINKKTRKKILLPHQILMLASLLKPNSFLHTWPPWNLQKKTDNYGPEIDQRICNVLQECWQSPYQKEEITYTLEAQIRPKMPLPSNHLRLTSTWPSLNDKLKRTYNTLTMHCAEHDKSLACLMDMLTMAEATCYDEGKLVLEELEFDFPNTNRLLA